MDDSFYSQFGDTEAPQPKVREVNWQANREDNSKPYVNREPPRHEAMELEQKDESSAGYWRMFTNQIPKGSFEQSVNIRFGGRDAIGGLFREKKIEYVKLYKSMIGEM